MKKSGKDKQAKKRKQHENSGSDSASNASTKKVRNDNFSFFSTAPEKKPAYVVTIPVAIPITSEDELASSSCSSGPELEKFKESDFKNPPFKINKDKRGEVIDSVLYYSDEDNYHKSTKKSTTKKLIQIFENEAFDAKPKNENDVFSWMMGNSVSETQKRLGLSLGLNRMQSISKRRNRALLHAVNEKITTAIQVKRFAFFWAAHWEDTRIGKEVKIAAIRSFYKQLKKYNKELAKKFLEVNEGKVESEQQTVRDLKHHKRNLPKTSENNSVPYRELREIIKDHLNTQELIQHYRPSASDVYLGIMDSDLVSLRSRKVSTFSHYDQMIQDHWQQYNKPLEMASSGYLIYETDNPMLQLGVELDLCVRHQTAQIIKRGIYYSEPNSLVRVRPGESTVKEHFYIQKENNYASPKELPNLMHNVMEHRKLDPQRSIAFGYKGAITTTTPDRMKRYFKAHINNKGKIVRWRLNDFHTFRDINQSHLNSRDWAITVLNAFIIPGKVNLNLKDKNFTISGKQVKNMLISLISRLFNSYDPIAITEKRLSKHKKKINQVIYFQKKLCRLLQKNRYQKYVTSLTTLIPAEKRKKKNKDKTVATVWRHIDAITNIDDIKSVIDQLLDVNKTNKLSANEIQQAVVNSFAEVAKILKEKLSTDFTELSFALAEDYFNELRFETRPALPAYPKNLDVKDVGSNIHLAVVQNEILDNQAVYLKQIKDLPEKQRKGLFGMTPMHWAAITGNKDIIEWFISKKNKGEKWIADVTVLADGNVTALHCAIKYCADNGNDLQLIELLSTPAVINAKTIDRKTPLFLALTELDDPVPVARKLVHLGALPQGVRTAFGQLLEKTSPEELCTPILAAITYLQDPLDLIKAFVAQGFNPTEQGVLKQNSYSNDYEDRWPIMEAIKSNNIELVRFLLEYQPSLTEIYDGEDRPLLFVAKKYADYEMMQLLIGYGADINEETQGEETTLLHEAVAPLESGEECDNIFLNWLLSCQDIDLEVLDGAGDTPLKAAIENSNAEAVDSLINAGTNYDKLKRDETKKIRELTNLDVYNSSEEKELEEEEANQEVREGVYGLFSIGKARNTLDVIDAITTFDFYLETDVLYGSNSLDNDSSLDSSSDKSNASSSSSEKSNSEDAPSPDNEEKEEDEIDSDSPKFSI